MSSHGRMPRALWPSRQISKRSYSSWKACETSRETPSRCAKVVQGLSFEEAAELEQRAHAADLERKQHLLGKRQKQGPVTVNDHVLTRKEQEACIWTFM
ncbi:hypothetical protein H4582DRAFT_27675 [Lactarius indigo]|nr:hypothetical protein H4582DRAFT_27675 [Lactarius indigo]